MKKNTKIILAVVLSVLFVAGLALGLYFGLKDKPSETTFADTGTVSVFDENTIKFSYICPYIEGNPNFEIVNEDGFHISYDSDGTKKEIKGEIISVEYYANKSEAINSATLNVTIDLDEKLEDDETYHAVIEANSIELKKEEYINPDITADFKVKEDDNGKLNAEEEKFKDAKAVVLNDVKAELYEKGGKAYFSVTAKADGLTSYNETAIKNYQVTTGYSYKTSEGRFIRWLVNDIEFSAENGVIKITGSAMKDDLIPGMDYKFVIQKGYFINDDKSVVNEEYEGNFTYIEQ